MNLPPRPPPAPFRRWFNVVLRGLHLVAVILLGAALLGAPVAAGSAATAVALSGLLMFGLDTWNKPGHLGEVSGLAVLAKLVLVGWMAIDQTRRPLLFWLVVFGSALAAHAPAAFRHRRLIGPRATR